MAQDQEYLTGNRKIRYPFAEDSVLSVDDDTALLIFGCFIDAAVQPKKADAGMEPYITGISAGNGAIAFTLACGGAECEPVVITCAKSRTRYPVVKGQTSWCWYTFVMSSDGIQEYNESKTTHDSSGDSSDSPVDVSGDILHFDRRCLGYVTDAVTSIQVYGGEGWNEEAGRRYTRDEAMELPPDVTVSGDVRLQAGYNMSFDEGLGYSTLDALDISNKITISAVPGAGAGKLPCSCYDASSFKTPGLLSKDGHARLFNDTCYDILPVKSSDASADLRVHAKCKACCTCQMYASIVNDRLVPLRDELLAARQSLQDTYGTYEENVEKWNYRINNAFEEDIVISANGVPLDAAGTDIKIKGVAGRMSRCGFSVMVRNDSFVNVTIELSDFSTNGEFFEAQLSYMNELLAPVVTPVPLQRGVVGTATALLPPGRSATFTCFIRLPSMVKTDTQSGFVANAKITAWQEDRLIMSKVKGIVI